MRVQPDRRKRTIWPRSERANTKDCGKAPGSRLEAGLWTTAFNAKSGATVAGARKFLIAYNVNLNTPDATIAQEIALRIREAEAVEGCIGEW